MLKDPVLGLVSADPRIVSVTTEATTIMLVRAPIRRGDITEVPMCTSVIRTAGVAATGIDQGSADSRWSNECIALAALFFVNNGHLVGQAILA
jgi:hypothetical protein